MAAQSLTVPTVFSFESYNVRVVLRDSEPWFVATDVCVALDLANAPQAVSRLDDDEKTTITSNDSQAGRGAQRLSIINESGLYSLILGSRKPEARRFKKWITSEVLPTLRKTGSYTLTTTPAPQAIALPPNVTQFNGAAVLTNTRLAMCFAVDRGTLRSNMLLQPAAFKLGTHYFKLTGSALRNFLLTHVGTGEVSRRGCSALIIWTPAGVEAHARLFPPAIAERGRQAVAAYLAGQGPDLSGEEPGDAEAGSASPEVPALPVPSPTGGGGMAVTLAFASPASLGAALTDLLGLAQRHGVKLSIDGYAL